MSRIVIAAILYNFIYYILIKSAVIIRVGM
jgi:hypothetical protein